MPKSSSLTRSTRPPTRNEVARLDVAVDDAARVRRAERLATPAHPAQRHALAPTVEPPVRREPLAEAFAPRATPWPGRARRRGAAVRDVPHDAGVGELRQHPRLALEAVPVARTLAEQHLEGDVRLRSCDRARGRRRPSRPSRRALISKRPATTSPTPRRDLAACEVTGTDTVAGAAARSIGGAFYGTITDMAELPGDITKITQLTEEDCVLRNLLITQRYHDLSLALAETLSREGGAGGASDLANVNWSTFATWASKTAGQSIRNEEVPPFVVEVVADAEDDVMHPFGKIETAIHAILPTTGFHASFLLAPVAETLSTVSGSISAGNLKAFRELAPQFVRFVQSFRGDPNPTDQKLGDWLTALNPDPTTPDGPGQQWLGEAFTAYVDAIRVQDPVARALFYPARQLPDRPARADAPAAADRAGDGRAHRRHPEEAPRGVAARRGRSVRPAGGRGRQAARAPHRRRPGRVGAHRDALSDDAALPGGASLPLGRNIPKDAAARAFLPAPLQNIIAPDTLVKVLTDYDRARGVSGVGSASVDWRVLEDRMNFIVNLFRSRQQDGDLLGQPFSDKQREAIEAGRVPDKTLGPPVNGRSQRD